MRMLQLKMRAFTNTFLRAILNHLILQQHVTFIHFDAVGFAGAGFLAVRTCGHLLIGSLICLVGIIGGLGSDLEPQWVSHLPHHRYDLFPLALRGLGSFVLV